MNLKDKSLTEEDYKKYILEHYTNTCFVINNAVYGWNSTKHTSSNGVG
jgi:arsenate reductase